MLNILKKSGEILKNNLITVQPLLLFLLIFMTALSYLFNKNMYFIPKIILGISLILMVIAFSAGWFFVIKETVMSYNGDEDKEETALKSIQNFKKFFIGVGGGFLKTSGACILLFIFYSAVIFSAAKFCLSVFGMPNVVYEFQKMLHASSQAEIFNILNTITDKDKLIFSAWVLILNIVSSILNYFIVLYFAVLEFARVNIFKTFWLALKFGFKNILGSVFILFFIFSLYVLLNILSLLCGTGVFGLFVLIILFCLYLYYYVILVFCFYNEKTKNNSNNGTELIG